jgi:hypothetical protein
MAAEFQKEIQALIIQASESATINSCATDTD